jgi:hypothetical protein
MPVWERALLVAAGRQIMGIDQPGDADSGVAGLSNDELRLIRGDG